MSTPDTVKIEHLSCFELCQLKQIEWDHEKGEYYYFHDFQDR